MAKPLAPCPSEAAYRRHLRWGQQPCNACRIEHARLQAEQRARTPRPPRELVPCGSGDWAYRRHLKRREVPCRACIDAHAAEMRQWYQRKSA